MCHNLVNFHLEGQKTLWKKMTMLDTCNFSFFHYVFKRFSLQARLNSILCCNGLKGYNTKLSGKGLTVSQQSWILTTLKEKAFEYNMAKGENAG